MCITIVTQTQKLGTGSMINMLTNKDRCIIVYSWTLSLYHTGFDLRIEGGGIRVRVWMKRTTYVGGYNS